MPPALTRLRPRRRTLTAGLAAGVVAATLTTVVLPSAVERTGVRADAATGPRTLAVTPDSWRLQQSAYTDGSSVVLTTPQAWRNGSAFYPRALSDEGLDISFTSYQGDGVGGQGMTMTLLDASTGDAQRLGEANDGEGYAGLPGVALSLDTSYSGPGDVNDSFLGIATRGTASALHYVDTAAAIHPLRGARHDFRVTYAAGRMRVWMDGEQKLTTTVAVPDSVYVGFTAATGQRYDRQLVDDVSITGTPTGSPVGTPPPAPPTTELGAFVGSGDSAAMDQFASWLGRRPDLASDVLSDHSWYDLTHPPSWLTSAWQGRYHVSFAVPMLPNDGSTIQQGATGAYDAQWRTLAQNLVAAGLSDADLRIGWEFNGDWVRWTSAHDPAAWKAYWRHIVTTMRSVGGANFQYTWNLNAGATAGNPADAYPGDDVVDVVGIQAYDLSWVPNTFPIPAGATQAQADDRRRTAWADLLNGSVGINHWADFAAAHSKPVAFPEWGLSDDTHGGGDDPVYVQGMHDVMVARTTAYQSYFNVSGSLGHHTISTGLYPRAGAVFRSVFAG